MLARTGALISASQAATNVYNMSRAGRKAASAGKARPRTKVGTWLMRPARCNVGPSDNKPSMTPSSAAKRTIRCDHRRITVKPSSRRSGMPTYEVHSAMSPLNRSLTRVANDGATACRWVGVMKLRRSLTKRFCSWRIPVMRCGPKNWTASGTAANTTKTPRATAKVRSTWPARPASWWWLRPSRMSSPRPATTTEVASSSSPMTSCMAAKPPRIEPLNKTGRVCRSKISSSINRNSGGMKAIVTCRCPREWATMNGEKPYNNPPTAAPSWLRT